MDLDRSHAIQYHYNAFPPKTLDDRQLIQPLAKAIEAITRYDQALKNIPNSFLFFTPLARREAILSSRIEGTISTMEEILEYEAKKSSNTRSEVIEVFLYHKALMATRNAIKEGYPLSPSLLKQTHQILLSHGRGTSKSPGQFKSQQNYLADPVKKEVLFVPISPEKLQDGIDSLFNYIQNSDHHALIKTALAHIEFEALHPFEDGNGRIGRMLVTLLLWQLGVISDIHFYISEYLEKYRKDYINNMRDVSANKNWDHWCVFFLNAIEEQSKESIKVAESVKNLYDDMKTTFTKVLSSKWSIDVLDSIFENPIFSNGQLVKHSKGLTPETAARFTRILIEKKIITTLEKSSGRKPAIYSFEPLIELIRV